MQRPREPHLGWGDAVGGGDRLDAPVHGAPRDTARDGEERDESDTLLRADAHELVILATGRQAVLVLHADHGGDRLRPHCSPPAAKTKQPLERSGWGLR